MKLCECGCGQPTGKIRFNCTSRGYVKGEYYRFVNGHQNRGRKLTEDHRHAIGKGLKGHMVSGETRQKISETHKVVGIKPPAGATEKSNLNRGKRQNSPSWKGGVTITNGYLCLYEPTHPRAHPNGYVYEHILVAEKTLGRSLKPQEVVHHINRDKTNNNPDNLMVLPSQEDHVRLHRSQGDML